MNNPGGSYSFQKTLDIILRFAILFLLFDWCFMILRPFIILLIWGLIIAVATYPVYMRLYRLTHNRKSLSAVLITSTLLILILIPGWLFVESIYEGVTALKASSDAGLPLIPPPGEQTATWPALFKPVLDIWELASGNLTEAMSRYSGQLAVVGKWTLSLFTTVGIGIAELIGSILLSGLLLKYSDELSDKSKTLFRKIGGKQGLYFFELSILTIRNVMSGIIGIAVIQTAMAALALFLAGVPYAGIWTLVTLILSIAQIGIFPVAIITSVYMFSIDTPFHAISFVVWMLIIALTDNLLKPVLLGRKSPVPSLIVFLGAIGGLLFNGFVGLFMGAVILSLAYKLFTGWLNEEDLNHPKSEKA